MDRLMRSGGLQERGRPRHMFRLPAFIQSSFARRLQVEALEDRRMLAITVDTLVDEADGSIVDGDISLRDAIAVATAGETIDFSVTGTINLTLGQITIDKDLTIAGPGLSQLSINAGANSRIFNINDGNAGAVQNVTLSGLTLQNARTTTVASGGALTVRENLTIQDSILTGNVAQSAGGAIRQFDGSLTIVNSEITNNDADRYSGGGIAFTGSGDLMISGSVISGNDANAMFALSPGGGAVIFDSTGTLTVANSTIDGNTAVASGGGVSVVNAAAVNISGSTISGNTASATDADGGGIYFDNAGSLTIDSSTISGNTAERDGGGVFARNASSVSITDTTISGNDVNAANGDGAGVFLQDTSSTITRSTVSGNTAADDGGGVYVFSGSAEIINSTISGNRANDDGAGVMSVSGGAIVLRHSTVTNNTADANLSGGGIGGGGRTTGTITLDHTIFAGNSDDGSNPDVAGTAAMSFSLLGDNTGAVVTDNGGNQIGTGGAIVDPLLGPLEKQGGVTATHALLSGSPAIDAGDSGIVGAPTFDQRDNPFIRIFDDPSAAGAAIDLGAYERQTLPTNSFVVDTPVDELNYAFGAGTSLREAVNSANGSVGADTITFDPGVFGTLQTITLALGEIEIHEAVTIDAAAAGNVTIDAQELSRVFNITATSGNFTLVGLTLTGGRTVASGSQGRGGAIRSLTTGNLTIDKSTVSGNSTSGQSAFGGGIYARGSLYLMESVLSDNFTTGAGARGGGAFSLSHVTVSSSEIRGNSTAGFGAEGGGLDVAGATISQSVVSANSTEGDDALGGGIRSFGDLTVTSSVVQGNRTAGDNAPGGGIYAFFNATITDSTVSENNTAGFFAGGGGIFASADLMLERSTVKRNTTSGDSAQGGGIAGPDVMLMESTVSGNMTGGSNSSGGGIRATTATLVNSTVSGNSSAGENADGGGLRVLHLGALSYSTVTDNHANHATATGGGIYVNSSDPIIANSIIAGNTAGGGMPDIDPGSNTVNADFSLIQQVGLTIAGSDNVVGSDPLLGSLSNNGGLTQSHALLDGSPAIDAGDPNVAASADTDQRGAPFARVADGGVDGLRIDMGAVERQTLAANFFVVDTAVDEYDGDYSTGDVSLREAVNAANGSPGHDTISFDANVFAAPQTSNLELGEMELAEAATINGPGQLLLTIDAQEQSRIFRISAPSGDSSLSGLTLTGGNSTDTCDAALSGGGGAVCSASSGLLTIEDATISNNSSTRDGGGVDSRRGPIELDNVTMIGNVSLGEGSSGRGGGIHSLLSVTLTDSTISDGVAGQGGGVRAGGNVTLIRSTVDGNTAVDINGGGINAVGTVTLIDSTVSDNSSELHGGGILSVGGVSLTNSTVSGNQVINPSAGEGGGGIRSLGPIVVNYSTVTGNHVGAGGLGGGLRGAMGENIDISNSIVAGNSAVGGIADIDPNAASLSVAFSLIGDNDGTGLPEAQTPDASGNLIGSSAGGGVIDPLLESLQNNGGPTQTHALMAGSPAVDAGDPAAAPGAGDVPLFDQRGNNFGRVQNGRIDIGALEVREPLSADFDFDFLITGADFLHWQRGIGIVAPNATKVDGDSDNDTDVDRNDLEIWLNQYGQAAPLAPAATDPQLEGAHGPALLDPPLIDAALGVEFTSVETSRGKPLLAEQATLPVADLLIVTESWKPALAVSASSMAEISGPVVAEQADAGHQFWLSARLLERVFG